MWKSFNQEVGVNDGNRSQWFSFGNFVPSFLEQPKKESIKWIWWRQEVTSLLTDCSAGQNGSWMTGRSAISWFIEAISGERCATNTQLGGGQGKLYISLVRWSNDVMVVTWWRTAMFLFRSLAQSGLFLYIVMRRCGFQLLIFPDGHSYYPNQWLRSPEIYTFSGCQFLFFLFKYINRFSFEYHRKKVGISCDRPVRVSSCWPCGVGRVPLLLL